MQQDRNRLASFYSLSFILYPLGFFLGWELLLGDGAVAISEFASAGSLESHDDDDAIMGPLGRLSRCH